MTIQPTQSYMSMDQNNPVNSGNEKGLLKMYGNRRLASRTAKDYGLETQSTMCYSPAVEKHDTSARRSCDSSETEKPQNILDRNKPAVLVAGTGLNNESEYQLSRDEIVSRRKLKVAARKEMKKLEKQQMNEKVLFERVEKPTFSLQLASEDFPTLDSLKTKKRTNTSNQETLTTDVVNVYSDKNFIDIKEHKSSKTVEKSWKPKVKDPIHIDLSQALQNKTEKQKPVLKKADPLTQRNLLTGNILDSDNPKRKKGKVRPDKVPKPSKLKTQILNERKKKLSETADKMPNQCLPSETIENDEIKLCNEEGNTDKNVFTSWDFARAEEPRTVSEGKPIENIQNVISNVHSTNIHSRRFREYCTNCLTEDLITSVCALLEKVAYFQDRMYTREPIKASAKRRYVAGINQVSKYLQVRKVKLLVIAPDLEKIPAEGGLNEKVQYLKLEAESQSVPCVFGPNRKRLGKAVKKNTLVSCVAVLNYEGAEEQYAKVLEALNEAKTKYLRLCGFDEDNTTKDSQDTNLDGQDSYASASDVTSSLLATLREELPHADKLLNAIQNNGSWTEE